MPKLDNLGLSEDIEAKEVNTDAVWFNKVVEGGGRELREKIEEVQAMGSDDMSEEERFLSEINLEDLENSSGKKQTYWLLAMQTYKKRRLLREQRATAEQEED